ncbi:laccase domain-containing protein, partial [Acinetobacter baumannii]|uniref:laccase domain-containing protein n=1 Tax=Acinetobacter baumannii TaxID=470 RepID=UPI0020910931
MGDDALLVEQNRRIICQQAQLPEMPLWLTQVHGIEVVNLDNQDNNSVEGDALYTSSANKVCAIMTADCLP